MEEMANLPKKTNGNNDWVEYRKLVLNTIERLETNQGTIIAEQVKIKLDIRELKVRAALWGGLAGGIIGLIGIVLQLTFGG